MKKARVSKKALNRERAQLRGKGELFQNGSLLNMCFRDVQRRAVILGMPFPEVVNSDYHALASFIMNTRNQPDMSLIDEYDRWIEKQLEEMGYGNSPMTHYQLRLGFVGDKDPETGEVKTRRIKGLKKPKERKKRVKNEFGIVSGTKKSLTFQLASQGVSLEDAIKQVIEQFPDAKENTIKIWYRKCLKSQK